MHLSPRVQNSDFYLSDTLNSFPLPDNQFAETLTSRIDPPVR